MKEGSADYKVTTPKGKTIEVKPDGIYGLWIIVPHGTNIPNSLKGIKYTSAELAIKDVNNWIESIDKKQNGKTNNS